MTANTTEKVSQPIVGIVDVVFHRQFLNDWSTFCHATCEAFNSFRVERCRVRRRNWYWRRRCWRSSYCYTN